MVKLENIFKPVVIIEETSKNFGKYALIEGITKNEKYEFVYIISNTIAGLENTKGEVSKNSMRIHPSWVKLLD